MTAQDEDKLAVYLEELRVHIAGTIHGTKAAAFKKIIKFIAIVVGNHS